MLAQQVHGEGRRERLRVQLSAKASRAHLFEEEHEYALGAGVAGVEDVRDLHTIGVDAGSYGDPPHKIAPQKDVDVVRYRPLKRPLQRLASLEHLDEAGD